MRAIKWAIDNMKDLASSYTGQYAKGNIDSVYTFTIIGRKNDKTYRTDIFFGLSVDGDNSQNYNSPPKCSLQCLRNEKSTHQ